MKYHEALSKAKLILKKYPEFYLTGSVALILQGLLPERDVKDIDFVCLRNEIPREFEPSKSSDDGRIEMMGADICIFAEKASVMAGPMIEGVQCCHPSKIIEAKQKYGRRKDEADFQAMIQLERAPS